MFLIFNIYKSWGCWIEIFTIFRSFFHWIVTYLNWKFQNWQLLKLSSTSRTVLNFTFSIRNQKHLNPRLSFNPSWSYDKTIFFKETNLSSRSMNSFVGSEIWAWLMIDIKEKSIIVKFCSLYYKTICPATKQELLRISLLKHIW